jgi:hypothetical protein
MNSAISTVAASWTYDDLDAISTGIRYFLSFSSIFFLSVADENFLLELSLPCLPFDLIDTTVTALSRL